MTVEKLCRGCNSWKPLGEYHHDKKSKDRLGYVCAECANEYLRERRHQKGTKPRTPIVDVDGCRKCNSCVVFKKLDFTNFSKERNRKDGFSTRCIVCTRVVQAAARRRAGQKLRSKPDFDRGVRVCSKCFVEKEFRFFPKTGGKGYGFESVCRKCTALSTSQRLSSNPEALTRRRSYARNYAKSERENLTISYVRCIANRFYGTEGKELPQEILELHSVALKRDRLLKEKRNAASRKR